MFSFFRKKSILDKDAQLKVVAAIKDAERRTSGEIRVFIEHYCSYVDAAERAQEVFYSLGMEKTVARNAIIIYIAYTDRQFALFGDKVIYEKAGGADFWNGAAGKLAAHLGNIETVEWLIGCIGELSSALAVHFPYDPTIKKNELPDEIVFGK